MNDFTTSLIECAGFALPMSVFFYLAVLLTEASAKNLGKPIRLPHKRFSFFLFLGFYALAFACVFLTGEDGLPVLVLAGASVLGLLVAVPTCLVTLAMRSARTKTGDEQAATVAREDLVEAPEDTQHSEEGFLMQCTGCGQEMDVPLEMAGQEFSCPTCGAANLAEDSTGLNTDQSEEVDLDRTNKTVMESNSRTMRKALERHGIKPMSPDHPIYSEPPSIMFRNKRAEVDSDQQETERRKEKISIKVFPAIETEKGKSIVWYGSICEPPRFTVSDARHFLEESIEQLLVSDPRTVMTGIDEIQVTHMSQRVTISMVRQAWCPKSSDGIPSQIKPARIEKVVSNDLEHIGFPQLLPKGINPESIAESVDREMDLYISQIEAVLDRNMELRNVELYQCVNPMDCSLALLWRFGIARRPAWRPGEKPPSSGIMLGQGRVLREEEFEDDGRARHNNRRKGSNLPPRPTVHSHISTHKPQAPDCVLENCEKCHGQIQFPSDGAGQEFECPHCGATIVFHGEKHDPGRSVPPPLPSNPAPPDEATESD